MSPLVASIDISSFSGSNYINMSANGSVNLNTWANSMVAFGQKSRKIREANGVQFNFNQLGYFFVRYAFVLLLDNKKFGLSNTFEARYNFIDGSTNINTNYNLVDGIIEINKDGLNNPTIQPFFTCNSFSDGSIFINLNVALNNPGISDITVRASLNSNFSNSVTKVVNGNVTTSMSLLHNSSGNIPGEVTVYVKLEKTSLNSSEVVERTETITFCSFEF
jgi:hypothetical protein